MTKKQQRQAMKIFKEKYGVLVGTLITEMMAYVRGMELTIEAHAKANKTMATWSEQEWKDLAIEGFFHRLNTVTENMKPEEAALVAIRKIINYGSDGTKQ